MTLLTKLELVTYKENLCCIQLDFVLYSKEHYNVLLYKLLKISLFIGPKRRRGKSSNCHINWLAHAGRSILVTKFRADVLVPLILCIICRIKANSLSLVLN